jgi:hypothetical protein
MINKTVKNAKTAVVDIMTKRPIDIALAKQTRHNVYINPASMLPFMDRVFHIHDKFYEMQEDYTYHCIPF